MNKFLLLRQSVIARIPIRQGNLSAIKI